MGKSENSEGEARLLLMWKVTSMCLSLIVIGLGF